MAKWSLDKRRKFGIGLLVIVLQVYLVLLIVVHLPIFHKHTQLLQSGSGILNTSLGKVYAKVVTRKSEMDLHNEFIHLSTYRGNHVKYTYNISNSPKNRVWKLKYENFFLSAPFFASENSRILFFKNKDNKEMIGARTKEQLKGEIHLVKNGAYAVNAANAECGYRSSLSHVLASRSIPRAHWYHKLTAIVSPEAWNFQHFLDGALPKIIQALPLLHRDPDIKLLFQRTPRDDIITEILNTLNISQQRVVYDRARQFGAEEFYFICIAPPLHPVLWQSARRLIGVSETLTRPIETASVVLVTRKGCLNCGRVVRNENKIVAMLLKRYGESRVKIFRGDLGLDAVKDMFGYARIVVGPHGGGLYNIIFSPINTTVIEFMPTHPDGRMNVASKTIFWSQASILGQIYWRMSVPPIPGSKNDMIVDLEELEDILEKTDRAINLIN